MQDLPLVTVSLETYNAESDGLIDFADVLEQLHNQTYPQERIEVDLVADGSNGELKSAIEERFPWARIVTADEPTYYGMKITGMKSARGDIIALTDADCAIPADFVERVVANFQRGADVVVGKVRFTPGARFAKTFNLFCFAHIRGDERGETDAFSVNCVAFRRELLESYGFDPRIRRSGGAYLLARKLKAVGYRIVYDPEIVVHHDAYDLKFQLLMRMRSGYEIVNLAGIDADGVLPEAKFRPLGALAPITSSLSRFRHDLRLIREDRRELGITVPEIPYFVAASAVIRAIEASVGTFAIFKPRYLADRFGW